MANGLHEDGLAVRPVLGGNQTREASPGWSEPSVRPSGRKSKIACSMQGNQMPAKLFPYFQSTLCDQWKT